MYSEYLYRLECSHHETLRNKDDKCWRKYIRCKLIQLASLEGKQLNSFTHTTSWGEIKEQMSTSWGLRDYQPLLFPPVRATEISLQEKKILTMFSSFLWFCIEIDDSYLRGTDYLLGVVAHCNLKFYTLNIFLTGSFEVCFIYYQCFFLSIMYDYCFFLQELYHHCYIFFSSLCTY